jgi:hypothetical protein
MELENQKNNETAPLLLESEMICGRDDDAEASESEEKEAVE